jgi:hypothetical protein
MDILTSYSPELKRPSFYEYDSYDSEIEWRFEKKWSSLLL